MSPLQMMCLVESTLARDLPPSTGKSYIDTSTNCEGLVLFVKKIGNDFFLKAYRVGFIKYS